jgi:serine/threonine protein kinase
MSKVIGTLFNERYRLDAEIGRGGMGVVYRAHDTLLERHVAIKVMSAAALGTEGRARLLHEARAVAQLNHPNIISVHDAGESEGSSFIIMELLEGESLFERRPDSLDEILSIARQICRALEHAHTNGIVHRDLKPENVLLTPDGTAKLTDFGLARSVASRLTSEGTIVGTVFYLAPELALGQDFDGRADLYALGVMLYELTTGRLPFAADDPVAVISQHLHAPVVPPRAKNDQIPPALDALVVRLLSKDPAHRPASAAEVLHILDSPDMLDREAAPAEEPSVLERIERGRLVGRERELQAARAMWSKALSGQGAGHRQDPPGAGTGHAGSGLRRSGTGGGVPRRGKRALRALCPDLAPGVPGRRGERPQPTTIRAGRSAHPGPCTAPALPRRLTQPAVGPPGGAVSPVRECGRLFRCAE